MPSKIDPTRLRMPKSTGVDGVDSQVCLELAKVANLMIMPVASVCCVNCVVMDEAFVTLVTSNIYALGALVLSSSLRRSQTTRRLVVMLTAGVSQPIRSLLRTIILFTFVLELGQNLNFSENSKGRVCAHYFDLLRKG